MDEKMDSSIEETSTNRPIRLAMVTSEDTFGKYSIFLEHFLMGLAAESIPVALVCPDGCETNFSHLLGVEVFRYPVFRLPFFKLISRKFLVEQLEIFEPTILHCLCEKDVRFARLLTKHIPAPYILRVDSLSPGFHRSDVYSHQCAKVIAMTSSIAESLNRHYPRAANKITEIKIGTFTDDTCRCFNDPARLPCIAITDPLDNIKDFEKIFVALKHLVLENYEFMLVLKSGGKAEEYARKLLAGIGLSAQTIFVPAQSPWRVVLSTCDVFIRAIPQDVFDPLLLEAMAAGVAVAACKGGVDDLIIENQTAVIFDRDNELSIKSAIQKLFDTREFARQIAKNAQENLRQNYTVSKMISEFVQVYREVQQKSL